ncbi:MAG: carboxypeptidase regulatory-like domain-containing protein, partial [Acidobacteria bacterium]|nr:carboxypeptidase regulatory-like domain-containing protein [Acidobacteriota bacterium]
MGKRLGIAVLVCVFSIQLGLAQTSGTISGVVQDSTGGVVPGASVIVLNEETGLTRTLETDAEGRYLAANMSPGRYQVEASVTGFQTEVHSGIGLSVGQEAVVNFTLRVGQVAERVEVTGEAPMVETTNATISGLATEAQIRDLPLNGRSYTDLVLLQTGVILGRMDGGQEVGGSEALGGGAKISISGARPGQNAYLLDGTDINDSRNAAPAGASSLQLGVDAVREFRLLTNAYSAEYGRNSGGVMTAITKSGTNDFHGTVFEFLRNDNMDAARWELAARSDLPKPPFVRNQFGGTVGGPIRQNQTFFFGAFEVLRDRVGATDSVDVPTARAKTGCMPEFGIEGNDEVCIPVHPLSQKWLAFYPDPNGPVPETGEPDRGDGIGVNTFTGSRKTDQEFFQGRIDHSFSQDHSIFGRLTFDDTERASPQTPLPNAQTLNGRNIYLTVQQDSVISPTTLNTFRFGYNRTRNREVMNYIDSFPLDELSFSTVPFDKGGQLGIDNISTIGTIRVPRGNLYRLFEVSDDVTLIRGAHTMKVGFIFKKIVTFEETWKAAAGNMEFDGEQDPGPDGIFDTSDDPGSSGLWDFLQGEPSEMEVAWAGRSENREWHMNLFGLYLQDDFKWKPNFTFNLGVRWEFMTSPTETDGQCSNLTRVEQVLPFSLDDPNNVGPNALRDEDGNLLAPLGRLGCPFFETFKNNIAPRFGFAWDTRSDQKLVVRGGFGLFYDQPLPAFWRAAGRCCPPFAIETAIQPPFPFAKADTFVDFSNPPTDPVDIRSYDYSGTTYMMQYNFNIQSQIRPGTAVTIGYSGSQGRKLPITRELQTIPRTTEERFGSVQTKFIPIPGSSVDPQILRNPYASSMLMGGTQGSSNYNALLISADHRFGGGLRAQVNYTFSKTLSHGDTIYGADLGGGLNSTGIMDGLELGRDWGPANYHIPHVLSVNYTYDLPFQAQGVAGQLIGGWQLAGIFSRQAGISFDARTARFPDHSRAPSRRDYLRADLLGTTNNP